MGNVNKYRNQKIMLDGELFDSKGEADRFSQLRWMERARTISGLSRQPRFIMSVNGKEVCELRADFAYFENGRNIIEDFKGMMTTEFRLKLKLFKALHPDIEFRVTNRKGEVLKIRTRKASKLKVAA